MSKKDLDWHINDIADEYSELQEAVGLIDRWSEKSDVVYTVTRARWTGYVVDSPISKRDQVLGTIYMFSKYTVRFLFFRRAGKKINPESDVRQVRNPKKLHKIHHIAARYDFPKEQFAYICQKQYRYWRFIIPR